MQRTSLVLVSPAGVLWLNNDFPVVPSLVPWAPQSHPGS